MQNPFTKTFSKSPGLTYIAQPKIYEILENFSFDVPSESVFKITGVRGSGKTVILAKIEEELKSEENRNRGWLVFDLNPTRDMLSQIAAMLHNAGYGERNTKSRSIEISANILGSGGGFGYSTEKENPYFDIGVQVENMIQMAKEDGKRIFIGIDEISKTSEMIKFTAEYGRWLRANYPVYLVCTGLYENIQEVCNVKNLTFFRRATTIKTEPLNFVRMTEMYKKMLDLGGDVAKIMAKSTKGYAYAFQTLGSLYFNKSESDTLEDVIYDLKTELFAYSYEKIWEEMSDNDRFLVKLLIDKSEYKREEVLSLMGNKANNYSMYRDRLLNRGILESRFAHISLALPFFAEYIKEYVM